ncbi:MULTISPECIES: hypothetical protein [Actinomycetes]|uniref:Uncharacterized protein n=2 Tax=Actinomycetes TaxID=1760 RepID=A0ABP6LW99_9MICC
MTENPQPKAYRPFVAARYPASGQPVEKPVWRVIVHRKHVDAWNRILDLCGESNAQELWQHLTTRPDQQPLLGTVTPMKGRRYGPTADGMSRVYHYEVTGAARVDYRFNPNYRTSVDGDPHRIVQIISISLGSH